jgi:UDP-glucose 4-epimerase
VDAITIAGRQFTVNYRTGRGFDVPQIVLDNRKLRRATDWQVGMKLETGISSMWRELLGQAE